MALTGTLQNHLRGSRDPDTSLVFEPDYMLYHYTAGSSAGSAAYSLAVPASTAEPVVIENVEHFIVSAFTGSPTIGIGDGSGSAAWIATASITSGSVGTGFRSTTNPKLITDSARIVATVAANSYGGEGLIVAKLMHLKV
jgi:hypothetical protein